MEFQVAGKTIVASTGGRPFDATLPVLLFVHGSGMDHRVWALQTRYLAHHGYAVLAVDLPGHGDSVGPPLDSVEALGDWLGELIGVVADKPITVIGHSLGAMMALDCASRHPQRVERLALLGAAQTMPVHAELLAAAEANEHRAFEFITDWGHGRRAHIGDHPVPGLWMLQGVTSLLERAAPGVLYCDLAACNVYEGGAAAAATVACPTHVITGTDDRMTPARAGRALAGALQNAAVTSIANAGHMMMIEQSDATLDALMGFV